MVESTGLEDRPATVRNARRASPVRDDGWGARRRMTTLLELEGTGTVRGCPPGMAGSAGLRAGSRGTGRQNGMGLSLGIL